MSPRKKLSTNRTSLKETSIEQSITQSSSLNLDQLEFQSTQSNEFIPSTESISKPTSSEKRKTQLRSAQRTFSQRKKQREKLTSSQLIDATDLNREMKSTIARSKAEREVLRQYVSKEVLEEAKKKFTSPIDDIETVLQPLPGYTSPNLDSFNDLLITPIPNRFNRDSLIDIQNDENSIPQGSSENLFDRSVFTGKEGFGNPSLTSQGTFRNSNYPAIESDQLVSGIKPIAEKMIGSDEKMEFEETESTCISSNASANLSNGLVTMNEGISATDYQFETCGSPPELQFDEGWGEFWEIQYDEIEEEEEEKEEMEKEAKSHETSEAIIENPEYSNKLEIKKGLTGEEKKTEVNKGNDSALEGKRGGNENERNSAIEEAGSQNDLAQPMPKNWRPPNLTKGESVRQMLKGTQAWGRLMSHPLAAQCDKDELARALQKQAKCANGSPVVSRDDVMKIWLSIPGRVKGKKAGYKLGEDGRSDVDLGD